jgi:hypothetical protein
MTETKVKPKIGWTHNKISAFLSSQDSHGHPIQLTFDGETEYRSPLGGILSLFSKALVLSYFLYLVKQVFSRDQYTVMSSLIKNVDDSFQGLVLTDHNFDIGVSLNCISC